VILGHLRNVVSNWVLGGEKGIARLNYIGIHGAKENLSIGLEFEPGAMNRKLILSVPWSLPKHGPDRGSHAMLM